MPRVSQWSWNNDWNQVRAINEIDAEMETDRRLHRRRLREARQEFNSGLEKVDSRISSVSDRIDTVLEWTELRFQLIEFDEYAARKAIRKPFRSLAGGLPAAAPAVEDVPGYWMPPAAVALLRLAAGSGATSGSFTDLTASLELARERDAVRSELFSLAVGVCFDQPALIDAAALRLLGGPACLGPDETGEVAAAWRDLWEHAALGELGPGAAALLKERLEAVFDPEALDEAELRAWDEAIRCFDAPRSAPLEEADAFARLREHLSAAEAPSATGVRIGPGEHWRLYLQELIEEPSPAELPLVEAMEELYLPEDRLQRSRPSWSEPEGTVAALLREDLFDPHGPPALRALALESAAPLLRSRIEAMGPGPEGPEPITYVVKRFGAKITVGRDGHDAAHLEAAERRLERNMNLEAPSSATAAVVAACFAAAAVALVLTGFWPLALPALIGVAVPVWRHSRARSNHASKRESLERQTAGLRAELARAKERARNSEAARDERLAAVAEARGELLAVLGE